MKAEELKEELCEESEVGAGDGVGVDVGVAVGVGDGLDEGAGFLIETPLSQINLLPDLMQVNFLLPIITIFPFLAHLCPAIGVVALWIGIFEFRIENETSNATMRIAFDFTLRVYKRKSQEIQPNRLSFPGESLPR